MGQALAPIGFEIPPGMTEGTWRSAGYEPSGGRATAAKVLLGISTAVDGLLALWLISGLSLITRIMDGAATQAEVTSYDNTQTGLSSGSLLGYVVAGIAVLFWLARVVSNVPWLGGGTPQHSPGWSVGVWFIPVVFLVVPYVVVRNLWRRLVSPGRPAAAAVVAAWWLTFLAGAILTRFAAASLSAAETESALRGAVYAGILGSSLTVVSGILLIRIIGELETRCRVRATALGVVPTPPLGPAWGAPPTPATLAAAPVASQSVAVPLSPGDPARFCWSCGRALSVQHAHFCVGCGATVPIGSPPDAGSLKSP
jgi:hypothetical protein